MSFLVKPKSPKVGKIGWAPLMEGPSSQNFTMKDKHKVNKNADHPATM